MMTIEDLKTVAGSCCIKIYQNISPDQYKESPIYVQRAWICGRDLTKELKKSESKSEKQTPNN
jgi:hypothetical protein